MGGHGGTDQEETFYGEGDSCEPFVSNTHSHWGQHAGLLKEWAGGDQEFLLHQVISKP